MSVFSALFLLCCILAVGSGCFASIPFLCKCNKKIMGIMTSVGVGLLLGTALIVILPEGIHMLLEVQPNAHSHEGHKEDSEVNFHYYLGVSATLGYCFIYILSSFFHEEHEEKELEHGIKETDNSLSSVIGLLIHSFVDGIALGASALSKDQSTSQVVFFALLMHKAPASFGLGSFLKESQKSSIFCFRTILLFALSSPISALLTYGLINGGLMGLEGLSLGFAMEFSAGTFLYVGTSHILHTHGDSGSQLKPIWRKVCICIGAIIPYFLASQHSH